MAKRRVGRPKVLGDKSEIVRLHMPVEMARLLRKSPRGLSAEIRERLAHTLFDDTRDPRLRTFTGQIEQLARGVRRTFGVDWHSDRKAHAAFADAVGRLLAGMPAPSADVSKVSFDAETAGEIIYRQYLDGVREAERQLSGEADEETKALLRVYGDGGENEKQRAAQDEAKRKERIHKTINRGRS